MHTAISLAPNGPGILPMRHRGFDQDSPAWDIHQRAALLGYEITGRDDSNTNTSVGAWKEDVDTRGDLNGANYWQADYSQRPVGCWGFGYASVVQSQGSGSGGGPGGTVSGGQLNVLPLGQGAAPDSRFRPKSPLVAQPVGGAGGDPNAPSGASSNGSGGASDPNGIVDLGNGWQYQDGLIVQTGSGGPNYGNGYAGTLNPFGNGSTFNPLGGTGIGGLSPGQQIGVNFGNPLAGTGIGGLSPGQQIGVNFGNPLAGTGIGGLSPGQGFSSFSYGNGQSLTGATGAGFGGSFGVKYTYTSAPAR